ncbi:protein DpdF [Thalassotalea ponticola]|uniref:protein DpdF n=1 Tax=Thalassotalea ponticola TaxID=1523392 RepID=UPI0025B4904D|nr:protein DpdF [Thalassotalea ponticola]MDN3652324.1 protein DpdF [Thalassotalea ponticola]
MLFWDFYPKEKKSDLLANIWHFEDTQFKQRLTKAIDSKDLQLNEFWYLVKDVLASESIDEMPSLYLGIRPSTVEFQFARLCGLTFDSSSNSVTFNPKSLSRYVGPVYQLIEKRHSEEPAHDPILTDLNLPYSTFTSQAQQEAVRTTLLSPSDSTVIVNLPTGCGKTLVTETLTAFIKPNELNIVIVPTTSLAIDQARRLKKFISNMGYHTVAEYAWRGDLPQEVKETIKADILSGKQRILFVSPEAFIGGLLPTLSKVAEAKRLKNVIFDEAHLIDTWGESFRPEFQKVGAFLNSLTQKGGEFRKVFLSATFTEQALITIKTLFSSDQDKLITVNGAFLRPEPIIKKKKVQEIDYLPELINRIISSPKPLIVYSATKNDCAQIYKQLSESCLERLRIFTSDTVGTERSKIIELWEKNEIDIIIATSAFGVGIDKADVRCVLHAGVSENIDSYYQEIGRSGRDGKASYCEVIYHQKQLNIRNKNKRISAELGYKRWHAMWRTRKQITENTYQVQVNTQAYHIERNTDANEIWNWKTLLLMQRSNLIRLSYPDPTSVPKDKEDWPTFWRHFTNTVIVETLHDRHLITDTWENTLAPHRDQEIKIEQKRLNYLMDWLNDSNYLCDTLAKSFTLDGFVPLKACGTCDVDNNREQHKYLVGHNIKITKMFEDFPKNSLFYYDQSITSTEEIIKAFKKALIRGQISMLVCSKQFLNLAQPYLKRLNKQAWFYETFDDYAEGKEYLFNYSKFIVQDDVFFLETAQIPDEWQENCSNIFIANAQLKDPINPHRKWWESGNTVKHLGYLVSS